MKRLLIAMLLAFSVAGQAADDWPELKWPDLVPKHWDPRAEFKGMNLDLSKLQDSDPRAMELLDKLRQAWDNAPTEPALNGKRLRIAGFAIPLERKEGRVTEFLLLPYFGACIHSPPPPANQIIHVKSDTPVKGFKSMSAVWVSGTMGLARGNSELGVSGYSIQAKRVELYREK